MFFQRRLTDMAALGILRDRLLHAQQLNFAMQKVLRQWSDLDSTPNRADMFDQARMDWFAELNRGLTDKLDDSQFHARMRHTTQQLHALAVEIVDLIAAHDVEVDVSVLRNLLDAAMGVESGPVECERMLGQLKPDEHSAPAPLMA